MDTIRGAAGNLTTPGLAAGTSSSTALASCRLLAPRGAGSWPTPGHTTGPSSSTNPALRRLLALPDPVLRRVAGPPVVRDGHTLDLRVQVIISIGERLGLMGDEFDLAARRKQGRKRLTVSSDR